MSLINQNNKQQLDIKIRDFEQSDYPEIARINNAVYPDSPITAEEYIEMDQNRNKKCKHRRWVAIADNTTVGTGIYTQHIYQYHPQKYNIRVIVLPEYQNKGIGSKLFNLIEEMLIPFNPVAIKSEARDDMNNAVRFLEARGYKEFQRYAEPHLDVDSFDFALYENLLKNLKSRGIEIKTMKELETDPRRDRKMYELEQELGPDMPDEDGFTPIDFETFKKEIIEASYTIPDAYFIAVEGDRYIGLSVLMKFKTDKSLFTGLTGVKRSYRRLGIATCLKVRAIGYAKKNHYSKIKTENQFGNQPMLSLNRKLGFRKQYDWICFKKLLENNSEK
ncbi:MAG: GNAT family N-acetyltransferase [Candidatus Zixiibacteriota bacterium]|nr:MAG: GNAT family N-acetyltransferase [candidate division Zixibacteria bacterium]